MQENTLPPPTAPDDQSQANSAVSTPGVLPAWNIVPAEPLAIADQAMLVEAIIALRLVGVQFRLYPADSEIVKASVRDARAALLRLLADRSSLIITCDGSELAFDGLVLRRRDIQIILKDLTTWLSLGRLSAVGFTSEVREEELAGFFQAIASETYKDSPEALLEHLAELGLENLQIISQNMSRQFITPAGTANPDGGTAPAGGAGGSGAPAPARSAGMNKSAPKTMQFDPQHCDQYAQIMVLTDPEQRRIIMTGLNQWLVEQPQPSSTDISETSVDQLLIDRIMQEDVPAVLQESVTAAEKWCISLIQRGELKRLLAVLQSLSDRAVEDASSNSGQAIEAMLERICESAVFRGMLSQAVQDTTSGMLDNAHQVMTLLGERAIRSLIAALKTSNAGQERARLIPLLCEFGRDEQSLLVQELRLANPWFIYRNFLQVIAEVGNDQALDIVSERMRHEDARVRLEAVSAAVKIAKNEAAPYLAQGLKDASPDVRTRAASLVGLCPDPGILSLLLELLQAKDEPLNVQMAVCSALGHFSVPEAREVLLQILHPRLFSAYRKKNDEIRAIAVLTLASSLDDAAVQAALKGATRDRHQGVRQAAQRALQQKGLLAR